MNNPQLPFISPTSVGAQVYKYLAVGSGSHVSGTTSRGVFLSIGPNMIAFLSKDSYRGPLTINLPLHPSFFEGITLNLRVDYQPFYENKNLVYRLVVENSPWEIHFDDSNKWNTPVCLENNVIMATRSYGAYLQEIRAHLDSENEILDAAFQFFDPGAVGQTNISPLNSEMRQLAAAILSADKGAIYEYGRLFSGRGRGLTPSGDDFLLGLIFTLKYLEKFHSLDLSFIDQVILPLIEQRSTTISSNLINCAAQKEIDERLLVPFDQMRKGLPFTNLAVKSTLDWGSSSGVDALTGMVIAFWLISTGQ